MEGAFMIMQGIAVCLLIAVSLFWLILIGFGIYWITEHKKEIKEQQREVQRRKQLVNNIREWTEDDMKDFKIVNK